MFAGRTRAVAALFQAATMALGQAPAAIYQHFIHFSVCMIIKNMEGGCHASSFAC
jgi:hypothetical protein